MDTKTLLNRVAQQSGMTAEEVSALMDALGDVFRSRCADMDTIAIPGFGSFETRKRLERVNVHPSTGKRMLLPPKIVLTFKPSALLKQKLNR